MMTTDTRNLIEEITSACPTCEAIATKPRGFSIRDTVDIVFNQSLLMNLMYIDARPVLHVVDAGTRFTAASFLPSDDAQTVWNAFVRIWSSAYVGLPQKILVDQGSIFMSRLWTGMCEASRIELRATV
jgi:hypothetical protein